MVLLPVYLAVFAQSLVSLSLWVLGRKVATVLLVPLVLALLSRGFLLRWQGNAWLAEHLPKVAIAQLLCLNLVIAPIFAAEGATLIQRPGLLLRLLVPIGLFFIINFVLAQQVGRVLKLVYPEVACLNCTTLARNSPIALAVAATAFSDRPLIALTLVMGPLLKLPILALVSQLLWQRRSSYSR